ncbi:hypothetical protein RI543_000618 [Arxiozyma heterogenica]|uniref:Autophagy-related protein 20 n=1 Tax=Arxiozyma heterogenica TaxID=278026 RepID=A0AAN8A9T2_9SACH|nr:hypothetical protein RI543_000618 [Kazachstania heterogenica]
MGSNSTKDTDIQKQCYDSDIISDISKLLSNNSNHSYSSIVHDTNNTNVQRMIHTKILQKDNPFLNNSNSNLLIKTKNQNQNQTQNNNLSQIFTMATEKIYKIKNPNGEYLKKDTQENTTMTNTDTAINDFDITKNDHKILTFQKKSHNNINSNGLKHTNITNNKPKIIISETINVSEGQGRNYIAYNIIYKSNSVRRRYSDFDSLRNLLIRLFLTTFIPPIPAKQNLKVFSKALTNSSANYLLPTDIGRSLELSLSKLNGPSNSPDDKFIRRRVKILTSFLNLLSDNDEIMNTSILVEFLNPNAPCWNDFITNSPTFSTLPKNILQCNPLDPTNTTRIHASLPIPSSSSIQHLKVNNNNNGNADTSSNSNNDLQNNSNATILKSDQSENIIESFGVIENNYKLYETICNSAYKYNKKIMKNFGDMTIDYKDLCQEFLNFSNRESQQLDLAEIFLYFSSAFDKSHNITNKLVTKFDNTIIDKLNEITYMASSVKELIKFQRLKYAQREMIKKTLQNKQNQLNKLQIGKDEFKSIDKIIDQEMGKSHQISFERPQRLPDDKDTSYTGRLFKGFNKLANMVRESVINQDIDPDLLMDSLNKEIEELKEICFVINNDLIFISKEIKEKQLSIFSQIRQDQWSLIMKICAKAFKEYAERNLKVWKELKSNYEIEEKSPKMASENR